MKNNMNYVFLAALMALLLAFSASAVSISSINLDPNSGKAPLNVKFSATLAGTGPYLYAWDLGDGFTATKSSFDHTYSAAGKYSVSLIVKDESDNSTETKTAEVDVQAPEAIKVSINANPVSGNAPLTVNFAVLASGEDPFEYQWDLNGDGNFESKEKNPSYTYNIPSTYEAMVKVTDASGNSNTDSVNVYVTKFDPKIKIDSYSPKTFNMNSDVTMSLIIVNTGNEYLSNIDAKTLSDQVVFKKSSTISSLAPNDKDSITITFTSLSAGSYNLPVKILGKNFDLAVQAIDINQQFNAADLQIQVNDIKAKVEAYEQDYITKKATGYLVGDIADDIKSAKDSVQAIQQSMILGKLSEVNNAIKLIQPQLDDVDKFLKNASKPKKSFMDILKENAAWITTVLAAFAALGGFFAKAKSKAKALAQTAGHHIKNTFSKGKEMPQAAHEAKEHEHKAEQKPEHHAEKPKKGKKKKE